MFFDAHYSYLYLLFVYMSALIPSSVFYVTATTEIYSLYLHDAFPISRFLTLLDYTSIYHAAFCLLLPPVGVHP